MKFFIHKYIILLNYEQTRLQVLWNYIYDRCFIELLWIGIYLTECNMSSKYCSYISCWTSCWYSNQPVSGFIFSSNIMDIKKEIGIKMNYRIVKAPSHLCEWENFDEKSRCEFTRMATKSQLKKIWATVFEWHNLVPSILRNSFALLISGTTVTPSFKANYCALWNDSTPPNNTNTQLWTELLRWLFTNRYAIDNVAYLDKFFSTPEVNGLIIEEVWVFVDWTWVSNSWFLLSRININETMWPNETLTINASFTIV
jgi:hypothetical protein